MEKYVKVTKGTENTRFESGLFVYDEAIYNNQIMGRYMSCAGQILPEMHLTKDSFIKKANKFPLRSFELTINGKNLALYDYISSCETDDETGLLTKGKVFKNKYKSLEDDIEVTLCTRLDGTVFMQRWLEIENLSNQAKGINSVYPMSGRVWLHDGAPFVCPSLMNETSTQKDFSVAYFKEVEWGREGDFRFEDLDFGKFSFDGGKKGRSGWSRPAFWLRDNTSGQIMVVEFAYSGNWEFNIYTQKDEKVTQAGYSIGIGALNNEYVRVLAPKEKISTPMVHFALFPDCPVTDIVHSYHNHIRKNIMPPAPKGREVEIEANHRGYLCDRENEEGIIKDVDVAKAVGTELYVIDAGWYGQKPNRWWNNVGDWFCGEWLPNGLKPIADHVHKIGMKFGLWIEVEAVGENSKLAKEHPDWRMMRGELPCAPYPEKFGGRALDLSKPEVIEFIENTVSSLIEEYDLDMYRIDHNHRMGIGGYRERYGMRENVLWTYYENFYKLHKRLAKKYPNVVFQNCAGGGGRLDLGILNCFHNTESSDWARPPRVAKMFNNISMILPPEKMLCIFGTETLGLEREYDLFSQMCAVLGGRPIFRGISPTMEELNPLLKKGITDCMDLYNSYLRPVMIDATIYHHTPMLNIFAPAKYTAVEYAKEDKAFIVVRSTEPNDKSDVIIYPKSITPDANYKITLVHKKTSWEQKGIELINNGIKISECASEIMLIEKK